jgi:ubiquinone/menaquinone biosynthesis C-methylase UbiE
MKNFDSGSNENKARCFDSKAESYDIGWPKFGAGYASVVKYYTKKIGAETAIEVAAGTGLHTKRIASLFQQVTATDPNAEMLDICRRSVRNTNVTFLQCAAEHLGRQGIKADMLFVAQAFNLLDEKAAKENFKQCLNENGLVVLAWNNKNDFSVFEELKKLIIEFCPQYATDTYQYHYTEDARKDFFKRPPDYVKLHSDVEHRLSETTFMSRCLSSSYAPNKSNPRYNEYKAAMQKFFNNHKDTDEKIYYPLETTIYIGEL